MWLLHAGRCTAMSDTVPCEIPARCVEMPGAVAHIGAAHDLHSMLGGQGPGRGTWAPWYCTCDEFFCRCIAPCC